MLTVHKILEQSIMDELVIKADPFKEAEPGKQTKTSFNKFLSLHSNWNFFKNERDPMVRKRYLKYAKTLYLEHMKEVSKKQQKDN